MPHERESFSNADLVLAEFGTFGQARDQRDAQHAETPCADEQRSKVSRVLCEPPLGGDEVQDEREVPDAANGSKELTDTIRIDVRAQHRKPDGIANVQTGGDDSEAQEHNDARRLLSIVHQWIEEEQR